jgi:hypothetical protein
MTAIEFKKVWGDIEGKPLNISYGKQVFKNIVLKDYNEQAGTVKTTMKGLLNTRAIKTIEVVQHKEAPAIAVEAVEVIVAPKLPEGWNENGYFVIVGKLGGIWKRLELRDMSGEIELVSKTSFEHAELFSTLKGVLKIFDNKQRPLPKYLIDDSFVAPVYYKVDLTGVYTVAAN